MGLRKWGGLRTWGDAESVPIGTVTIGTVSATQATAQVNFSYSGTDETGYKYRLNSGTPIDINSTNPFTIPNLTAGTQYTVEVVAYNATGDGNYSALTSFTTEAEPVSPIGTITFGSISVTESTASVPFSYNAADETGYEYQLGSGAIISATSPISLSGLTDGTLYAIKVRAINATGSGDWYSDNFTTETAQSIPVGTVTIGAIAVTQTSAQVNFTYSNTDATGYKYRLNNGLAIDINNTNPFTITGLTSDTSYTVEVLAYNAVGDGSYSAASSFTTEAEVVITSNIYILDQKVPNGTYLGDVWNVSEGVRVGTGMQSFVFLDGESTLAVPLPVNTEYQYLIKGDNPRATGIADFGFTI
tara:strand:+ start:5382 stop:6458 length:1077 start_codon:yes stop_codon:yes gene_type:complete